MNRELVTNCRRCGRCCLADFNAYIKSEDIDRWKEEQRNDILAVLEQEHGVWMGDHLVSSVTGRNLGGCPFFAFDGRTYSCSIYETRPATCRRYEPGSSEICPEFRKNEAA